MAPNEVNVVIPEVPPYPGLPEAIKKKWRQTYEQTFLQARHEKPNEGHLWAQSALIEANRLFRVPKLEDHADALDLEDWQVILREERDGRLNIVTIDGRKYSFAIPRRAAAAPPKPPEGQIQERK